MTERVSRSASISLLISIALTLALWYVIPFGQFIAYPLTLLSTLAHELGHGLAALSVGHSFQSLKLYVDGSGVAYSTGGQGISQGMIQLIIEA